MPALYGITSNANVSVSNTTGLYIGSGNVLILNSAQTLNTLLSNQGNVNFALTSDNSQVYAYSLVPINNYGNANVAAYLPVYPGILGVGPTGIQLSSTNTNFSFNAGTPNNPGPESIAIGYYAGHDNSGQFSIAQGYVAGYTSPGANSIAIGAFAGFDRLPTNSIAIGYNAAYNNGGQANFSVINATGSQLNPTQSNSFYVAPIRTDATNVTYSLYYNTTTKEITYTTATAGTTYSNANVQAYLAANTDPTIQSLNANTVQQQSQINSINANVTAANLTIQTISANLGSFETYANVTYSTIANAGSLQTQINSTNANVTAANAAIQTISANLGSFETYANVTYSTIANAASQESEISGLRANITAANAAIQTISANLGSFETYANVTYSTIANAGSLQTQINSTNGNVTAANAAIQTLSANVGSFYTWANANFGTSNYSNANVSSYLSSGSVNTINTTGNITTTANVVATGNFYGNLIAANVLVANIGIQNYTSYGSVGAPSYGAGVLWYDSVQDSIAYYNSVLNNEVNVGQELQFNAYNGTGSTINQGVPVYLTGGSFNNLPNIAPAIANTISTSQIAGVANQNIPNNTIGCVVTVGVVANVAMGTFSVGDTLYLSPYSAGQVSNTQPPTGFVVKVGTVLYNNSPNGRFLVNKTVPVNNQYYGNLTLTGNLSANNATITNKITTGSILSTGNITANTGAYFIGDGSQLANLPTQAGTYSNTNVSAYLSGNITTGNITNTGVITATGNITAPNFLGTAQYFTGDLHGNVLYDSTKYRFFANAYPLSIPDNTKYANGFLTWIVPTPVYTAGVVQAPAAGSGLTTQGGQTLGAILSANVYIAPAGGAGNRSTNGHMAYTQVMPTGNMAGVDRSRGLFSQLDVNLNGTTWGTMGPASQASLLLCASAGTTQLLGSGSAAHAVGFNSVVAVAPTNGNIAVQYATGTYNFISLASNSAVNGTTIQYARLVSGSVAGQTANLSIVNMIGIHTATGWATTGSINPTNRYAVLNEDAGTVIQTNGNINVVSTATTGLNSTGVFTATALNAITGVAGQFASVSNGTGKSGGAMAYWDTTNNRWSWFDTNLAVS